MGVNALCGVRVVQGSGWGGGYPSVLRTEVKGGMLAWPMNMLARTAESRGTAGHSAGRQRGLQPSARRAAGGWRLAASLDVALHAARAQVCQ
jgi:hypothetical protein